MTLPLKDHIYKYNNKRVVIWINKVFDVVEVRCIDEKDHFEYFTINWFKFAKDAKHLRESESNLIYH